MRKSGKMAKVLVVDDEPKIRRIYKRLLLHEKYKVLEAEDAKAASRFLVKDKDIHLVLLDVNMPVVDGGILYRMIRMLNPKIKVLVTSAYPIQDQKNKIDGADDYYEKSQGADLLLEKIKHLL
jgi:CheY-like chemotaxis protein